MKLQMPCSIDAASEMRLRQNGFVVIDRVTTPTLENAYPRRGGGGGNTFVTTDAFLQLWFEAHKRALTAAERDVFPPRLLKLLPALTAAAAKLREGAARTGRGDAEAVVALREAEITCAVASRLLAEGKRAGPPPATDVQAQVEVLMGKVMAHNEAALYPGEDYTHYTVRGHYAEDPALARYFRASLWLSRRFLPVNADTLRPDPDAPLRTAIALAAVVRAAAPGVGQELEALNALRASLAGPPNALSVTELTAVLDKTLGPAWTLAAALRPGALAAVRTELTRPEYAAVAAIASQQMPPGAPFPERVVALLPGIAVPDSVLFQNTIHPRIAERSLPTGLEVAAALGSDIARQEVQAGQNGTAVLAAIDRLGPALVADSGTVYNGWLRVLSTLNALPENAPAYMRSDAWRHAKLNTMLGGWAHLRHGYRLYAEQAHAEYLGLDEAAPALVEPNPAFFAAMALLADRTRALFDEAGAPAGRQLAAFAQKCREFGAYAQAELDGKLTREQAEEIDGFGDWVDGLGISSPAALVADVATGMTGEVLHAATGDLNLLLVLPDPANGIVYSGWVLSYYEFVRPARQRLTDAAWQAENQGTYRRPDRPSWASAFLASEAGPVWEARAPLREAERLLYAGKADEGLALLRKLVAENPDAELATEAQYRVGKHYFDRKEWDRAKAELRRCEKLPGGDAFDAARRLANRVEQERYTAAHPEPVARAAYLPEPALPVRAPAGRKKARFAALRTNIGTLRRDQTPATTKARDERERALAARLLRELPWDDVGGHDAPAEMPALLREAADACRTLLARAALGYAALVARQHDSDGEERAKQALRVQALAYAAEPSFPAPLRAAALGMALRAGHLRDQPQQALALLRPFLKPDPFTAKPDPVIAFMSTTLGRNRPPILSEARDLFQEGFKPVRNRLVLERYHAGRSEAAAEVAFLFPVDATHTTQGEDFGFLSFAELWNDLDDTDVPALDHFGLAEGLAGAGKPREAAAALTALAERFPCSLLAPIALDNAAHLSREAGDAAGAARAEAVLAAAHPDSYPALVRRVQTAYESGSLAETRRLRAACETAKKRLPEALTHHVLADAALDHIGYELKQSEQRLQTLKPLLDAAAAAGKPVPLTFPVLASDGAALADALTAALPADRRAEIYQTVAKTYANPHLALRVLERDPDDDAAGDLWKMLVGPHGNRGYGSDGALMPHFPDTLRFLVPIVNRGPAYAHAQDALTLLERCITWSPQDGGGRNDVLDFVREHAPGTRAQYALFVVEARRLVTADRPERARPIAADALAHLPSGDPLHDEAATLKRRAEIAIRAKRQPDWNPLWSATYRLPDKDALIDLRPPALAAQGLLLMAEADDSGAKGRNVVVAFDGTTGARRWATALAGDVRDLVATPDRVFCIVGPGTVVSLDLATGAKRWERTLDPQTEHDVRALKYRDYDARRAGLQRLAVAGAVLIVCGGTPGVGGVGAADGAPLWQQPTWQMMSWAGEISPPAVFGDSIVIALDATVRAVTAATGVSVWEKEYEAPAPSAAVGRPSASAPRRVPVLMGQPVALGPDRVLVAARQRPQRRMDVLDVRSGNVVGTAPPDPAGRRAMNVTAGPKHLLEWGGDSLSAAIVRRLPDLAALPVASFLRGSEGLPALAGTTAYLAGGEGLRAVDLETGAELARGSASGIDSMHGAALTGDGKVFVLGLLGKITAYPQLPLPRP